MKKMTLLAFAFISICTTRLIAKEIVVPGLFIEQTTTKSPEGSETTVKIVCALVSEKPCYTINTGKNSTVDPRIQNGPLETDAYESLILNSGEVYKGAFLSHYQWNELTVQGTINRVHAITIK